MTPVPNPRMVGCHRALPSLLRRCVALLLIAALLPIHGLFAFWADASGDGIPDSWVDPSSGEVFTLEDLNAISWDIDGDGLSNASELALGTNPFLADTDGDGLSDAVDPAPLDASNYSPSNGTYWYGDALSDPDSDGTPNFYDPYPYDYYNGNNPWAGDTDGDGIPNSSDPAPDDYNNYSPFNGVSWYGDVYGDADGDGIDNFHDAYPYDPYNGNSPGNSSPDPDSDYDGMPDSVDPAPGDFSNYSAVNNVYWYSDALGDADNDGTPNFYDAYPYDPYDGNPPVQPGADSDGDGIPDSSDPAPNDPSNYSTTNWTAWGSDAFGDADGDGVQNFYDAYPYDPYNNNPPDPGPGDNPPPDNPNPDSDYDGIPDSSDPSPWDYSNFSSANNTSWYWDALGDADGDGIANFYDQWPYDYYNGAYHPPVYDSDGDGIVDPEDPAPNDPTNTSPINGVAWFTSALADADGDGNPNFTDPWPYDPYNGNPPPPANPDIDGDGIPDVFDPAPGDPTNTSPVNWMSWYGDALGDFDGDGILNFYDQWPYDSTNGSYNPNPDSDGDGIPDANDPEPNDPTNYSSYNGTCWYGDALGDSDNDGTQNFYDSYPSDPYNGGSPPDTNPNPDSDGDGIPDSSDPVPGDASNTSPINGVSWYGNIWGDDDADGVQNFWDSQPYGEPQVDSDGDGLLDNVDPSPGDPNNYSPFNNTSWLSDALGDADGDGIANFFDEWPYDRFNGTDDDGDGIPNSSDPAPGDSMNYSPHNGRNWYGDEVLGDLDNDGILNFFDIYPEDPYNGNPPAVDNGGGDGSGNGGGGLGGGNGNPGGGDGGGGGIAKVKSPYNGLEWGIDADEDADGDGISNYNDFRPYDRDGVTFDPSGPTFSIGPIVLLNDNYDEFGLENISEAQPENDLSSESLLIRSGPRVGEAATEGLTRITLELPVGYVSKGGDVVFSKLTGAGEVRIHALWVCGGAVVESRVIGYGEPYIPFGLTAQRGFQSGEIEYWAEGLSTGSMTLRARFSEVQMFDSNGQEFVLGGDVDVEISVCERFLSVDANRDGKIIPNDMGDETTMTKPFRFWVNEDNDALSVGEEVIDAQRHDYDFALLGSPIANNRDLEDHLLIKFNINTMAEKIKSGAVKVGFRIRPNAENEVAPTISLYRIFPMESIASDYGYLREESKANVVQSSSMNIANVSSGGIAWCSTSIWSRGYNGTSHLLLSGRSVGRGSLEVWLKFMKDPTNIMQVEQEVMVGEIYLHLLHAGEMIQRAYVSSPSGAPLEADDIPNPTLTDDSEPQLGYVLDKKYKFEKDPDESDECVIHVHGWRMSDDEARNWSEMSFKRLWHLGFKGRFASFAWPTYTDEEIGQGYSTYNESEYRAWLSGPQLAAFVNQLPFAASNRKIFAHSMGNIVVGSAFRSGMLLDGPYVMQHAAVSASSYDPNPELLWTLGLLGLSSGVSGYLLSPDSPAMSQYARYGYKNKFNMPNVNAINFCLPADSALGKWELNQGLNKPDVPRQYAYFLTGWPYRYTAIFGLLSRDVVKEPEALAFVTRSLTGPAGSVLATRGAVRASVDLSLFNFGSKHSAEWNMDFQKVYDYWLRLAQTLDVEINQP